MKTRVIPSPAHYAQTASAAAGAYAGHCADWATWLPSYRDAVAAYNNLPAEVRERIRERAAAYGLDPVKLVQKMPQALWGDAEAVTKFLDVHDVSHILPTSTHAHAAGDNTNWTWEHQSPNSARKATVMTAEEYQEAQSASHEWASDFTGDQSWWDMNEMWKDFLRFSEGLGYSGAWLPKELWLEMMQSLRTLWNSLRAAGSFQKRMQIASAFTNQIHKGLAKWQHHIAAAFMLSMLSIMWPPAALFIQIWGMTSLASMTVNFLRKGLVAGQRKHRWMRLFSFLNRPLKAVQKLISAVFSLITKVKELIIAGTAKVADAIFTAGRMAWTKVVKPAVQAVVRKAKNLFVGFLNWASGLFRSNDRLAQA